MSENPTAPSKWLTIDRLRHWLRDRKSADNLLHGDLRYSDEEVKYAMEDVANHYNAIPPFIGTLRWDRLPRNDAAFYHGVAYQLYNSKLAQLIENEVTYSAGEVQVDHDTQLIERLKSAAAYHEERFRVSVAARKLATNASNTYGAIGC